MVEVTYLEMDIAATERALIEKSSPSDKILTKAEVSKMKAKLTLEPKIVFMIMIEGGLRVGEALGLKKYNVRKAGVKVFLKYISTKWRGPLTKLYRAGKITKEDFVKRSERKMRDSMVEMPLMESTAELLEAWIVRNDYKDADLLFPARRKGGKIRIYPDETIRPRSTEWMEKKLRRAAKEAGIGRKVNCHMCRHTFVSRCKDVGMTDLMICDFTGHKSPRNLRTYSHATRENLDKLLKVVHGEEE